MLAVIRVRGGVGLNPKVRKTLELLGLHSVNHLALVGVAEKGMLERVQGYLTWGEIDAQTMALLLQKRGRLHGNKRLNEAFLKEKKIKSFGELAKNILGGKASLGELGLKTIFRLGPPKKGFERAGIKKTYKTGGALGYRASDINALIKKMV
jgi:large subunit ribosomal protein L30